MAGVIPAILQGVEFIMQAVTFVQFIYEEAIQTANMGTWIAIKNRRYSIAKETLDYVENTLIKELRQTNKDWGWIAPYSMGCFKAYADATERAINAFRELTG